MNSRLEDTSWFSVEPSGRRSVKVLPSRVEPRTRMYISEPLVKNVIGEGLSMSLILFLLNEIIFLPSLLTAIRSATAVELAVLKKIWPSAPHIIGAARNGLDIEGTS